MRNRRSDLLRTKAIAFAIALVLIGSACGTAATAEPPAESLPVETEVPPDNSLSAASPTEIPANTEVPAATEIPTAVPNPTEPEPIASGPATANFSLSDSNNTPPGDVLNEIGYAGMGGGYNCLKSGSEYKGLEFDAFTMDVADWLGIISVIVCGWQDGEQVEISLQDPNGNEIYTETQSAETGPGGDAYAVVFVHGLTLDNPVGEYTVTFSGNSGTLQKTVEVSSSQGPKMYFVDSLGAYYLYGFAPGEHIRFFCFCSVFKGAYDLTGWTDYTADQNGNLLVYIGDHGDAIYRAIGDVSGEVGDGLNPHGPDSAGAESALRTP